VTTQEAILDILGKTGIIPVIKIDDAEKAVPLARALLAGHIPCIEITFRTSAGEEAIRRIQREVPEILLGAGTILTTDQVDRALDAGAQFLVSPGYNSRVVKHAIKENILMIPGCSTPSDMEQAIEANIDIIKFFPAEQAGGLASTGARRVLDVQPKHIHQRAPLIVGSPENVKDYQNFIARAAAEAAPK